MASAEVNQAEQRAGREIERKDLGSETDAVCQENLDRGEIKDSISSRSQFYLLLSKLYAWPLTQQEIDGIDIDLFRDLSLSAGNELCAEGFNDVYRSLRRKNTGTQQMLNADYTAVFLGSKTYKGFAAQPYASLFLSPDAELYGSARKAVMQEYRKNRFKLDESLDVPEDHLSFECEFMAKIGDRALEALEKGDCEEAVRQLNVQYDFANDHILTWFGRFFNLANKMIETRFYRGVLKVTKGFLSEELDVIAATAADIEALC